MTTHQELLERKAKLQKALRSLRTNIIALQRLKDDKGKRLEDVTLEGKAGESSYNQATTLLEREKTQFAILTNEYKMVCEQIPRFTTFRPCSIQDAVAAEYPSTEEILKFLDGLTFNDGTRIDSARSAMRKKVDRMVANELRIANEKLKSKWTMDEPLTRDLYFSMPEDKQRCVVMRHTRINIEATNEAYKYYLKKKYYETKSK